MLLMFLMFIFYYVIVLYYTSFPIMRSIYFVAQHYPGEQQPDTDTGG